MEETIFDKLMKREFPVDVVYEDDNIFAFRDINPQANKISLTSVRVTI